MSNTMPTKRTYPAATRNSKPIAEALLATLDRQTPGLTLLEIASGCGQHLGYFAPLFPNITFQPTEYDRTQFDSISAYALDCSSQNILQPLFVDIREEPQQWQEAKFAPAYFDYMFNSNMMHISPWQCSEGLFRAAGYLLKPAGTLYTYGPYALNGVLTPESNVTFDLGLRRSNASWGVRDIADLCKLAQINGLQLQQIQDLPSNNKLLSWLKA